MPAPHHNSATARRGVCSHYFRERNHQGLGNELIERLAEHERSVAFDGGHDSVGCSTTTPEQRDRIQFPFGAGTGHYGHASDGLRVRTYLASP